MKDLREAPQGLPARLLETMLRIRLIEEAVAEGYASQQMRCPVHLSIGQEAVAAGVGLALQPEDLAMSGHRSHAHYLAKGGSLEAMIAELHGRAMGCCQGRGGSMHLVDLSAGFMGAVPIVGSTIPIATGLAFADKQRGIRRVTVAFLGEAATEEGVFHESVNFAVLHALPILYVCENNLYSVYSPLSVRQPQGRSLARLVAGHGLPSEEADGNDPWVVHQKTSEAARRAREGHGPSFLEFSTYRWREHCGPGWDNHIGYRTEAEYLSWRERDPIAGFEAALALRDLLDTAARDRFVAQTQAEIRQAFSAAHSAPFPEQSTLFDHLYAPTKP